MTRERPILFSGPMVRAILAGRKTQTRRIVKPAPAWAGPGTWRTLHDVESEGVRCPYGAPGDRLWVRETWCHEWDDNGPVDPPRALYAADPREHAVVKLDDDGSVALCKNGHEASPWKPSIHMPRWASRITLEVTAVRVERLQNISEEDAKAEGVTPFAHDPEGDCWTALPPERKHRTAFEHLWGEINGWQGEPKARAPWASNPWVWVVGFRVLP